MAARVTFTDRYDHTFPSRAMKTWSADWSGLVPDEVAARAIAMGRARAAEGEDLPRNVPKLRKIARAENVDVTGVVTAAEIIDKITAVREALRAVTDSR